ncbi:MAG: hypothetical protein PVI66_02045 [Candidatus Aminicenantes bacterium]
MPRRIDRRQKPAWQKTRRSKSPFPKKGSSKEKRPARRQKPK